MHTNSYGLSNFIDDHTHIPSFSQENKHDNEKATVKHGLGSPVQSDLNLYSQVQDGLEDLQPEYKMGTVH